MDVSTPMVLRFSFNLSGIIIIIIIVIIIIVIIVGNRQLF